MTCTDFWKQTVWLSRYESHLLSKWFLIQLFRLFFLSSKKKKMTHAWVWLTIVSRGVAPSIRWFWKVAGFLKNQEGLINLLLQRSENIWKGCSSSLLSGNELTYLQHMAANESIRNWWAWLPGFEETMVLETRFVTLLKFCFLHNMTWL